MALKLLKFALVAVAVLSLFDGTEQTTCRVKGVPREKQERERCTEPRNTTVQLQVPEGFAFVEPSFVRVKQCTGLSCGHRRHCVPDDDITVHTYRVKAYKENQKGVCKEIEVVEHGACQCQCQDPGCRKNMVVEEDTCECVCDPEAKENCEERQRLRKDVMWSSKTCSCVCNRNHRSDCGTGEVFDEENCECVAENNGEDDNDV